MFDLHLTLKLTLDGITETIVGALGLTVREVTAHFLPDFFIIYGSRTKKTNLSEVNLLVSLTTMSLETTALPSFQTVA